MRLRAVCLALAAAAAMPSAASAHATLIRTEPADSAVLNQPPASVRLVFDDTIRAAPGAAAIRNGDGSVLRGKPAAHGRVLVVPLRRGLGDGDYSVRWSAYSDDGHKLEGVLAFAVGAGRPPPTSALTAGSGGPATGDVVSRWLFFAGLLAAVGLVVFELAVWRPALAELEPALRRGLEQREAVTGPLVLCAALAVAFLGDSSLVHHGGSATRFARVFDAGAVVTAVGAAVAAIASVEGRVRPIARAAALAALVVPSLGGHALDPGQPRPLNFVVDLLHVGSAAVWVGGLLALGLVAPRAASALDPAARTRFLGALARRFSGIALLSVALLSATGLLRALFELSAVHQVWTTGYGRALVVKSALLVVLVGLGWQNRARLLASFARLRRNLVAELVLLAGVVAAVAFLTDVRPGRNAVAAARATPSAQSSIAPQPPRGALVLAREDGNRAVGLAARPLGRRLELTATVLGPEGSGVDGLGVVFAVGAARTAASACGAGCYRALVPLSGRPTRVAVSLGSSRVRFELPARLPPPPAAALLRRSARAYRRLRSVVIHEHLASDPRHFVQTTFRLVAPNRLSYRIAGGAEAIIIGGRRWDRVPGGPWQRSAQTPLRIPEPFWPDRVIDASLLRRTILDGRSVDVVSMVDPRLPAWFEVAIDRRTHLPLDLRMTATSHFMHHRYGPFDRPLAIEPPR